MNDYNVVEQRNNKSPTHFEKEPYIASKKTAIFLPPYGMIVYKS